MKRRNLFVLPFLPLLLTAFTGLGQTLTNEQRLERCRTNADYIANYQSEKLNIEPFLRASFDASARHDYGKLNDAIPNNRILTPYRDVKEQQSAADYYNLTWNPVWATDKLAFQKALRTKIVSLMKAKSGSTVNEWIARSDELSTQIRFHEDRRKELRCNDKTLTPTDSNPAKVDLSGKWKSEWGYEVVLKHSGNSITGTFTSDRNVGIFTSGSYDNQTCKVTLNYEEPWKKGTGKVIFTLSANGNEMPGHYVSNIPGYSAPQQGGWKLWRYGANGGGCTVK